MFHKYKDSRGYSLLEMLVYVAIFSMALVLCSKIFVTSSRLSLYSTQTFDRLNEARDVQRDFRDVARAATAVAPVIGEHRTDDHTLVLQLHHAGEPPRYAVLGMFDDEQRLSLLELVMEDGELRAEKFRRWRLPITEARFEVDATGRCVTLALTTQSVNPQRPDAGRVHRFVAALRVDPEGRG